MNSILQNDSHQWYNFWFSLYVLLGYQSEFLCGLLSLFYLEEWMQCSIQLSRIALVHECLRFPGSIVENFGLSLHTFNYLQLNVILCLFLSNLCSELVHALIYACLFIDFTQKLKKRKEKKRKEKRNPLCEIVVWGSVLWIGHTVIQVLIYFLCFTRLPKWIFV